MALMSMEWSLLILIFHFSKAKLLALILSSEQEKDGALRTARKTTRARTLQKLALGNAAYLRYVITHFGYAPVTLRFE
jgi:hypothetical protein